MYVTAKVMLFFETVTHVILGDAADWPFTLFSHDVLQLTDDHLTFPLAPPEGLLFLAFCKVF